MGCCQSSTVETHHVVVLRPSTAGEIDRRLETDGNKLPAERESAAVPVVVLADDAVVAVDGDKAAAATAATTSPTRDDEDVKRCTQQLPKESAAKPEADGGESRLIVILRAILGPEAEAAGNSSASNDPPAGSDGYDDDRAVDSNAAMKGDDFQVYRRRTDGTAGDGEKQSSSYYLIKRRVAVAGPGGDDLGGTATTTHYDLLLVDAALSSACLERELRFLLAALDRQQKPTTDGGGVKKAAPFSKERRFKGGISELLSSGGGIMKDDNAPAKLLEAAGGKGAVVAVRCTTSKDTTCLKIMLSRSDSDSVEDVVNGNTYNKSDLHQQHMIDQNNINSKNADWIADTLVDASSSPSQSSAVCQQDGAPSIYPPLSSSSSPRSVVEVDYSEFVADTLEIQADMRLDEIARRLFRDGKEHGEGVSHVTADELRQIAAAFHQGDPIGGDDESDFIEEFIDGVDWERGAEPGKIELADFKTAIRQRVQSLGGGGW